MPQKFNTTVLVAPLDWGLGHATRCIPIVRHLVNSGCSVVLATDGMQRNLLAAEFPELTLILLNGYNIRYSSRKRLFSLNILLQLPKILRAIYNEHRWLRNIVQKYNIDAIISDNRYGLWHPSIPSVFLTHQLEIQTPVFKKVVQQVNYRMISRFAACWVPDVAGFPNIAGSLSHPGEPPAMQVSYLGGLSRFSRAIPAEVKYKLLIIISGPEPQRSILESKLLEGVKQYSGPVLFVRGKPGATDTIEAGGHVTIYNHLTAARLNQAFAESELIVSRSGYTTVMDILKMGKRSILIPTPGQTEQEYLADHLAKQGWCFMAAQGSFNLSDAIEKAASFRYALPVFDMDKYKKVLDTFIQSRLH